MFYYKRYTKEELGKDQRLCKILMSAVTAAIVIASVIGLARMVT